MNIENAEKIAQELARLDVELRELEKATAARIKRMKNRINKIKNLL